mmetsp:Transcript_1075/g.1642  ORF Transcript_1075/g.1642 Transcript_1075/m.1642 type:complete len:501 (-) Transcript_1075:722-2224(-)
MQYGDAPHVGAQHLRHRDAAIGVLVVLQHGHQRAAHGQAGAVQRVHQFVLAQGVLEARLHAAGLEGAHVRAGADLAVGVLRRQPDLQVIGLDRAKAHVARAQQHRAVRQAELLQDGLGVAGHLVERRHAVLGMLDADHLDLVELVLADHAAGVAAGRARLRAEAGAVGGQLDGQILGLQHTLADGVGQRDLRGRDQVLLGVLGVATAQHPEHVLLELGQLARALQDLAVDDVGRVALGVAVLGGLHVKHELRKRAVQAGDRALQKGEARARQLGAGLEVQAQRGTQVDMVLHVEVEAARRAPAAHLDVAGLVRAERNTLVGQVGHAHQQVVELVLDRVQPLGAGLEFIGDAAHLSHLRGGILALALGHADLLGQRVAARLQFLGAGLHRLALGLQGLEALHVEEWLGVLACVQALDDGVELLAQLGDVEHVVLSEFEYENGADVSAAGGLGRRHQDREALTSAMDLSPRPTGSGKRTFSSTPGRLRTVVAPSWRSWSMTA